MKIRYNYRILRVCCCILAMCGGLLLPLNAQASTTYNLAADWKTSPGAVNPNDVWSYDYGSTPLPTYVVGCFGETGWDGWTLEQNATPAWMKLTAPWGEGLSYNAGDVGDVMVHAAGYTGAIANVTWTSPQSGVIDISGQAWDFAHYSDRIDAWSLRLNGTTIAHRDMINGIAKNSVNAFFANNLVTESLTGLSVKAGDVVTFEVITTSQAYGHVTGVDLGINLSPVPAPSSILLLGTGLIGLAGVARRKKKGVVG